MSRAEIAAAVAAYRTARDCSAVPAMSPQALAAAGTPGGTLVELRELVIQAPMYRSALVMLLHDVVRAGTYRTPAAAIVEQLLGRLVAAALPPELALRRSRCANDEQRFVAGLRRCAGRGKSRAG